MKSISETRTKVRRWLSLNLTARVASPDSGDEAVYSVSLGEPSEAVLRTDWATAREWALDWFRTSLPDGVRLDERVRRVGQTRQDLPSHLRFDTLDAIAAFAGSEWPQHLKLVRHRWSAMRASFPATATTSLLRQTREWSDVDFDLLLSAAAWFRDTPPEAWHGLTPRQVPVEGLHAKWLDRHRAQVQTLAGVNNLTLEKRPTRIHFTYADPNHRDHGGRKHDSLTLGDRLTPAYTPQAVLICENKDTVVMFPRFPGLVVVEGGGTAGMRLLPQVPWIARPHPVIYWGDLDADGFTILNGLRREGIPATSILMDHDTYERFEQYGAWTDPTGRPVPCRPRQPTPHLTATERRVYEQLTDPTWSRVRRVEQERIPLSHAVEQLHAVIRSHPYDSPG